MRTAETTCWSIIDLAATGGAREREEFAQRYFGPVYAYLEARWRNTQAFNHVDDAVQEVFLQCFSKGGPLERVDRGRTGGFRAYLYGIVRNVARTFERRDSIERQRSVGSKIDFEQMASDESSLSIVFNRAWGQCIMQQAAREQLEWALQSGDPAVRRIELLRLRFHEGKPIREISQENCKVLFHEP